MKNKIFAPAAHLISRPGPSSTQPVSNLEWAVGQIRHSKPGGETWAFGQPDEFEPGRQHVVDGIMTLRGRTWKSRWLSGFPLRRSRISDAKLVSKRSISKEGR